ncbi:long-chain fatty acid--CoA ligase [Burkholderia sp. SRS-W-2-2016]|uniref:class I adenylate-forming enzyme family protein n=1 Tax=Burkholderia sp. SRS-W-2-2016 TaxID=1926878 RepID=UPI00094B09A3|nr:class I adenylate-forming enzyme family protein [Burkholderia sp. SRS-W-2-2016]OLL32666.1 long-chain fatty acid--CoA ligase [Burkholderia sp. SRS-W-2-2016]
MTLAVPEPHKISDIPRYWAASAPAAIAIREDGAQLSFGQLWQNIEAAMQFLREQEVGCGDRVMIVAENCTAVITLLFALSELGAWPAIVNARLSEREIEAIRAHCQPRLMLFTQAASPDAVRHGVRYRAREIAPAGLGPLMLGAHDSNSPREPEALAREVAVLIYTSGTTGKPKGVMATHRGLLHFARVSATSRNMTPADCAYAVMPVSHIFGLATLLLATFQAGASLLLAARFSAEEVLGALAADEISILQGVPTMFTRIVAQVREQGGLHFTSKLRYLYTGGGPLDPTLKKDVEALFGQPLHHGYGMTEYAGSLFITRMERPRSDCASGEIVEGAELRIVDANGDDVARGAPGELWVRGPGVMRGYYRAPEQTAEALRPGGWLNTGDIGRLGDDGALFIVGRTKDLIIRSGFNVYPIEVESVINTYEPVKQSAVVGRTTADGNEEVIAYVEVKEDADFDAEELRDYLADRLSAYKRPTQIVRIDAIPTTASGKLLKQKLRELAAESQTHE